MRVEKVAAFAEIISSVAIVVTLAYLAIQSEQTNDMLLGNSRQVAMTTDVALLTSMLGDPETASLITGDDPGQVKISAMLGIFMRGREYQWFQYRNGSLDRETLESYMSPAGVWLRSGVGEDWWASTRGAFDPVFVEFVNGRLTGGSP